MPIYIFGRPLGVPTGNRVAPLAGNGGRSRSVLSRGAAATSTKASGRAGSGNFAASNAAGSDVFQFTDATGALGSTMTHPLSSDADWVEMTYTITVSASSASVTTDLLNAIATIEIIAPDGPIIRMVPNPDFYLFVQRFTEYGSVAPTTTVATATVTTSASDTYAVPVNLPKSRGPYTVIVSMASSFASAATVTTTVTLSLRSGVANQRTRYAYSNLPFTAVASGTQDLAPLAPIQDVELQELFFTGMTSNSADINYIQIQSEGSPVGPRVLSGILVARDKQSITTTLPSTYLYPLLALKTSLKLGRSSHFYITWGASPASTIRNGFYWFD